MRQSRFVTQACTIVTFACFMASCSTVAPERFARPSEVFPPASLKGFDSDAPFDSVKSTQVEAPFEDTFRAATVAASQSQFNIEESNKAKGWILATRVIHVPFGQQGIMKYDGSQKVYTYAIVVTEQGKKSTKVQIGAKMQRSCKKYNLLGQIMRPIVIILTFGLELQGAGADHNQCEAESQLNWATGQNSSLQEMTQFLIFLRNNLIAAGVL